jgi:hypothetical protein
MQTSLVPIRITQQLPSSQGTADLKTIGLGDDGFEYALKRLEDHPLLPISEWVGYQLSRAVGLFTPDFAPVWLDDDTPAFGSRWEQAAQIGVPPHPVELAHYFGGSMRPLNESIFAVDAFLPNEDRHGRNFMWRTTSVGAVPLAFDFSRAWLMTGLPFGGHPLQSNSTTLAMWSYLKAQFGYQVPAQVFQKIALLPNDWLQRVLDAAPSHWLVGFDPKPTIDFWMQHRQQRCTEAMSLL